MAEVDALGRAFGEARRLTMGAAAAFDHRDLRHGDRRARHRPVRRRGIEAGQTTLRPSIHGAGRDSGCAASRITRRSSKKAKVVLDPSAARRSSSPTPRTGLRARLRAGRGEALLDEVSGLVEWPVVLMGAFERVSDDTGRSDPRHHPQQPEVFRGARPRPASSPMVHPGRQHRGIGRRQGDRRRQRARDPRAAVGREVLLRDRSARPSSKSGCRSSISIVFHEKLGTQGERIERIERLAAEVAPLVGADVEKAKRAARLCKTDLLTEVVGEFPELQGLMEYYALAQGEDASVAAAIEEHYKPQGPNDRVRTIRFRSRWRSPKDRYAGRVLGDRREADGKQRPVCAAKGCIGCD